MKQYKSEDNAIHFMRDEEIPEEGWIEIKIDYTALPDPNYVPPYTVRRQHLYPEVTEQLDMLWHMMDDDIIPGKGSLWYNLIKNIKNSIPKE